MIERRPGTSGKGCLEAGPGAQKADAPPADADEALWLTYYQHIFNPARLKLKMMQKEMPKRYWKNLPEAQFITELTAASSQRRLGRPCRNRFPAHIEENPCRDQMAFFMCASAQTLAQPIFILLKPDGIFDWFLKRSPLMSPEILNLPATPTRVLRVAQQIRDLTMLALYQTWKSERTDLTLPTLASLNLAHGSTLERVFVSEVVDLAPFTLRTTHLGSVGRSDRPASVWRNQT